LKINSGHVKRVWRNKTIDELAAFTQLKHPEIKGFNRRGLYRMKQFFETYSSVEFVSSSMTQIQEPDNQGNPMRVCQKSDFVIASAYIFQITKQ
jgi:hypothetical protein